MSSGRKPAAIEQKEARSFVLRAFSIICGYFF